MQLYTPTSPLLLHFQVCKGKGKVHSVALGGLVVSVLATGPKVRRFDPDRGRWIFKGDKKSRAPLLSEGK
jgi:hypothetical protein